MTRGSEGKQPELRPELYMIESDEVRFVKTESPAAGRAPQPITSTRVAEVETIESKLS
jgi:hypothetical protein